MVIRESAASDEGAIRELFALCFGRQLTHDEWSWKYQGSPWGGTAAVALADENMVAHYGGLKEKFYCKGKVFDVFQPCDVMTHPKFRARIFSRRGAMVKAGEYFYETNLMDFAFGFPSERHAILGTKQLGYTEHGYVSVLRKKVSRFGPALNPLLKIETGWESIHGSEIDLLWKNAKDSLGLTIEKNSGYIFWRYRDNPVKQYLPVIVRSRYTKKLEAFAVCRVRERDLCVVDFFFSQDVRFKSFLGILGYIASRQKVQFIQLWMNPGEDIFRMFTAHGYAQEKGVPFIFKILNHEITPSFLFSSYCYRQGDYDDA